MQFISPTWHSLFSFRASVGNYFAREELFFAFRKWKGLPFSLPVIPNTSFIRFFLEGWHFFGRVCFLLTFLPGLLDGSFFCLIRLPNGKRWENAFSPSVVNFFPLLVRSVIFFSVSSVSRDGIGQPFFEKINELANGQKRAEKKYGSLQYLTNNYILGISRSDWTIRLANLSRGGKWWEKKVSNKNKKIDFLLLENKSSNAGKWLAYVFFIRL